MKKITWVLTIVFLVIFVILGIIFYLLYAERIISPLISGPTSSPTLRDNLIYWGLNNNLYRVKGDLKTEPDEERLERFQSTGEVGELEVEKSGLKIAYDAKDPQGNLKLWQVDVLTDKQTKIFPSQKGDFVEFSKPKYSPDGTKLAYLGRLKSHDQILLKNLLNNQETILKKDFETQIADYSWSKDSQKIIFCSQNLLNNGCWQVDVSSEQSDQTLEGEISQISWDKTADLVYLKKEAETQNIFLAGDGGNPPLNLSHLETPKKAGRFRVNNSGDKVVWEVWENDQSNIYAASILGTEVIQLTKDNQSSSPIWSPDNETVAFFQKYQGIYTILANGTGKKKIVNLNEERARLLWWR